MAAWGAHQGLLIWLDIDRTKANNESVLPHVHTINFGVAAD